MLFNRSDYNDFVLALSSLADELLYAFWIHAGGNVAFLRLRIQTLGILDARILCHKRLHGINLRWRLQDGKNSDIMNNTIRLRMRHNIITYMTQQNFKRAKKQLTWLACMRRATNIAATLCDTVTSMMTIVLRYKYFMTEYIVTGKGESLSFCNTLRSWAGNCSRRHVWAEFQSLAIVSKNKSGT